MKQRLLILKFVATESRKFAWQSLKNCVKVLIGRKPFVSDRARFLGQYLLHATGLRLIRRVTSMPSNDYSGAGVRALLTMHAISFARASGLTYVHAPFTVINHADRPMPEWSNAWDTLFNLGAGEVTCDVGSRDAVHYDPPTYNYVELCFGWYGRKDELARHFMALIPEFRRKYYCNKLPRSTDAVTVAVHIRRGDVSASNNGHMFTRTEKILHTISAVKSILDSHAIPYSIRIYSQGDIADFAELSSLGAEFFLNADAIWTMQELIEADILIVAISSFSIYAGIISDGIKIFESALNSNSRSTMWPLFRPPDDWLLCEKNGSIDKAAFERQLSILTHAKHAAKLRG